MEKSQWMSVLLILIGLFTMAGGAFNWNWYMEHRKARFVSSLMGRNGARIFYVVFGFGMTVFGAVLLLRMV